MLDIRWSAMRALGMTDIDCGTSRRGVAVFVADDTAPTVYPPGASTLISSWTPATTRVKSAVRVAASPSVIRREVSTKPFADTATR